MDEASFDDRTSILPPRYAVWMDQLLAGPIPAETQATCDHCAMCSTSAVPPSSAPHLFNSQTKCCTYMPVLANFLVGGILLDDDPELAKGRATVEERIEKGVAVSPLGLGRTGVYTLLYQQSPGAFGKSQALRCPHYLEESGRCGVWRHRESTCATWFCKHVRGAVGMRFWKVVKQLLAAVELSLAYWCVQELDVGTEALQLLLPPIKRDAAKTFDENQLDGVVDAKRYWAIWGNWAGREREFYQASASLVNPLTWNDIRALCGPEVQILARLTQEAYRELLSPTIPPLLQVRRFEMITTRPDASIISAYSPFDPLRVPGPLLDALPYFDGGPTEEIRHRIVTEKGVRLDASVIRKLVDFEILAAPENESVGK